jgi:putative CocE/NonD family hydrolase
MQLGLKIPMRDHVLLSADLYRPLGDEPRPALLCRTIYDKQQDRYVDWAVRFGEHGYAVVIVDCRGRYDSDGEWAPYVCETLDGYDTQQWVGAQPWCNGTVGTFGISYVGFTQILPAPLRCPYLKALVPIAHQEDNFGHIYNDGVLQLHIAIYFARIGNRTMRPTSYQRMDLAPLYRHLPVIDALDSLADCPPFRHFVSHPTYDEYWRSYSMKGKYEEIEAPAYFITGWYDNLVHEVFKVFAGWKSRAREPGRMLTKLLVGPWTHQAIGSGETIGDVDFGAAASVDIPGEHLRWYDRRLKGVDNGFDRQGAVRLFVMGSNIWRDEDEWPLARTRYTPFYLHSRGRANSVCGDGALHAIPPGEEPPDTFRYDPGDPVPTLGGQNLFLTSSGPKDRRSVEQREDVLVYTGPVLDRDVEVTGPVVLALYAASSAVDTDFTAALIDVHPDGKAIIICEGIIRACFRESLAHPSPIAPGEVHEYRIRLWETSNVFRAGHRIRVEISSSNFPRFDRNLNTGALVGAGDRWVVAAQTVYHDARRPSRIILPIIPPDGG